MDIASLAVGVLGLIVSLCGFTIAVWQIRRTRTAAESAAQAATEAREAVLRGISISDLTQAHATMEELKNLHRIQDLYRVVRIYTALRQLLTEVRANLPNNLSEDFDQRIDAAIYELTDMEKDVDRAISSDSASEIDTAEFNNKLSTMQQTINELRVRLERHPSSSSRTGD